MPVPAKHRLGIIALLLAAVTASAAEPDYRELALHAGIIFRGSVVAVERVAPAAPGEVPVLRITFRVHEAVRGATAGQLLTVHQWDGEVTGDNFRVGESLALFLYPPSGELGLTSTVAGQQGRVAAENAESALAAAREAQVPAEIYSDPDATRLPRYLHKKFRPRPRRLLEID